MAPAGPDWNALLREALEAVRIEAARLMISKGLPLTIEVMHLIAKDQEGGGTGSEWVPLRLSGLRRDVTVEAAIGDDSVPPLTVGFRHQLERLATELAKHSDLDSRPSGFLPAAEGIDAILARFLSPLAVHYLLQLEDVGKPDAALVDQLVDEFVVLGLTTK